MGFTDFLQRGEQESSSGNMLRFLTITLLVAYATASQKLAKKIHKDMLVMNSMTACWGKGNMLAFKVGMKQAMETCMNENHSGLLKPANPLLALLNQNAETLPFPTNNNPFQLRSTRTHSRAPMSILVPGTSCGTAATRDKLRDFFSQPKRTSRSSWRTLRSSRETLPA